jgi:hypothetical protein
MEKREKREKRKVCKYYVKYCIYPFQDWITGVDMRIKSFFLSNFNLDGILEAFARTDLLEKIRLYLPSGMTGMVSRFVVISPSLPFQWASPKGFFNRESIIYH